MSRGVPDAQVSMLLPSSPDGLIPAGHPIRQRAIDHDGASFEEATVQLTGFVADEDDPFRLAR